MGSTTAMKGKLPDRPETRGIPYAGIENLRPETLEMLDVYHSRQKKLKALK